MKVFTYSALIVIAIWLFTTCSAAQSDCPFGIPNLHHAVIADNEMAVRYFLKKGEPVDRQDRFGCTLLYYVAQQNQVAIARLLLEYGASLDIPDHMFGYTPLYNAHINKDKTILNLFQVWQRTLRERSTHAKVEFCKVLSSPKSCWHKLPQPLMKEILEYVRPKDFAIMKPLPTSQSVLSIMMQKFMTFFRR